MREPKNVCVDGKRGHYPFFREDHICCLVSDPWKRGELLVCVRHLRMKTRNSFLAGRHQMLRFCFVVIDRSNNSFDVGDLRLGERLKSRIGLEKFGGNLVHLFVRALCGEHHGDKELVLVRKVELGVRVGIEIGECLNKDLLVFGGHRRVFYRVGQVVARGRRGYRFGFG